jgi:GxxExxY protein
MHSYDPITFPHRDLTEKIIGAYYDVYNELGFGFLENVYHSAMVIALSDLGLQVESEVKLFVHFPRARGRRI